MQIVIDIPEEIYKSVQDGTYCGTLYEELKHGTPLLYGHGRLIDGDSLMRNIEWLKETGWCKDEPNVDTYLTRISAIDMVLDVCVKPELTVIEADKRD